MSKKRVVNTHFWTDNYIMDLDPIEKLLFLYLLTNSATNMLGIYEIHLRVIAFETGIDRDMIQKIFDRFEANEKAAYKGGYVIMGNFMKNQAYNANMAKSAITSFNELPSEVRSHSLTKEPIKALKGFIKGSEAFQSLSGEGLIIETSKGVNNKGLTGTDLNPSEPLPKGSEPMGKYEYEYEYEYESELEGEGESENLLPSSVDDNEYKPNPRPKSEGEVISFFRDNGMDERKALEFYHHFESQGWMRKNGMRIFSWQSVAKLWMDRELHDKPTWKDNTGKGREEEPLPQYLTRRL